MNNMAECDCVHGALLLWLVRRAGVANEDSGCRCGRLRGGVARLRAERMERLLATAE